MWVSSPEICIDLPATPQLIPCKSSFASIFEKKLSAYHHDNGEHPPMGRLRRDPEDPGPGSAQQAPLAASASIRSLEGPADVSRAAPAPRDRWPRRQVLVAIRRRAPSLKHRAGRGEEESRDDALCHCCRPEPCR